MLEIISVPDKKLREVSQTVQTVGAATENLIKELTQTLLNKTDPPGVGLSAIQVGIPQRIFITYLPRDPKLPSKSWTPANLEITVFINPIITNKSTKYTLGGKRGRPFLEGCLSIPRLYGPVNRHQWIDLNYQTLEFTGAGKTTSLSQKKLITLNQRFSDFPARVIQHEYDHLEGILFTDYTLKANLPLYFEEGDELVSLNNPSAFIKW